MTDAERLADIRRGVEQSAPVSVRQPDRIRSMRLYPEQDIRWLIAQLDAALDDLRECSTFPCDTFPTGTHHANCRRCVAAETVGRLTL